MHLVGDIPIHVQGFGPGHVEPLYQGNMFSVGYGNVGSHPSVSQMDNLINIYFDEHTGKWVITGNYVKQSSGQCRDHSPWPDWLADVMGAEIANNPECAERLRKWQKAAMKRLKVSIPRLKQELAIAENRMATLSAVKF